MGKSSAPAAPDYTAQAIATGNSGKYNETNPYGSIGWETKPGADPANPQPGDYTRATTLSPEQQALYDQSTGNQLQAGKLGEQQLSDLFGGTQAMQDALYRRSTQYYDQNFGDQESALKTQLVNSGLTQGSEGYDKALRDFGQKRDTAYADATDRAIVGADASQNSAVNRLSSIMAISRGQNPSSSNSAGGESIDYSGAASKSYNSALASTNADNANAAATNSAIGSAAMMAIMYY